MRLLDTETGQFVVKDPARTAYAILSHTWRGREQTYQDLRDIQKRYTPHNPETAGLSSRVHVSSPVSHQAPPEQVNASSLPFDLSPSHHPDGFFATFSHPSIQPSYHPLPAAPVAPGVTLTHPYSSIWDDPDLSHKIRDACAVARENGYRYLWIDSCCIDKTSSSELSEAINSMYSWYAKAHICYAYLADVPTRGDHWQRGSRFRQSRWFTRGWTLQELIAPRNVVFLSRDWTVIGPKYAFADLVQDITGIDVEALLHLQSLDQFSIAQRLAWASTRETTRVEDVAYSLLGIFDINMPTLYGEGKRAFRRLQEEIMRRIPDQSLFAWYHHGPYDLPQERIPLLPAEQAVYFHQTTGQEHVRFLSCCALTNPRQSLLATTPSCFDLPCRNIRTTSAASHDIIPSIHLEYTPSPYGIRTHFQMLPLSIFFPPNSCIQYSPPELEHAQWYLALLGCVHGEQPEQLLGRVCYIPSDSESGVESLYSGSLDLNSRGPEPLSPSPVVAGIGLFRLSPESVQRWHSLIVLKTVYIPHDNQDSDAALDPTFQQPYNSINLFLLSKTRNALSVRGYASYLRGPNGDSNPAIHQLDLSHPDHTIAITYRTEPVAGNGWWFTITAFVTITSHCDPTFHSSGAAEQGYGTAPSPSTGTVTWSDATPWKRRLGEQCVTFGPIVGALPYQLKVFLDLEFTMMGVYALRVGIHRC